MEIPAHWSQGVQDLYGTAPHSSDLHGLENRRIWTTGIADGSSWPNKITMHWPHDDNSKRQNIEYIGKELMDMVWYCRQPMEKNGEFVACHECKSCKHVDDALSEKE